MAGLWTDLRHACRALARTPALAVTIVVTLGGGMALCTTALAIAFAYVGRALPYPAPDRLYSLEWATPGSPTPRGLDTLDWTLVSDVIEHAVAWDLDVFYLSGGEYPESVPGAWVTPGFADALGVRTLAGRSFTQDDFTPGRPPVALISEQLWQQRFASDPRIVGRTFTAYVSDRPGEPEVFTVIGVLPSDFWHVNTYTGILVPLTAPAYPYMVQARAGVAAATVADRLTAFLRSGGIDVAPDWRVSAASVQDRYTASLQPVLRVLVTVAALVLLIAGVNAGILLLLRGHRRQNEMALRMALGAGRARVLGLVAAEAALLGAAATIAGVAGGLALVRAMHSGLELPLGRRVPGGVNAFLPDAAVIAMVIVVGVATTMALAIAPIVTTGRGAGTIVPGAARTSTDTRRTRRLRDGFLAIELAASLTLVVGALLVVDSARRVLAVESGFADDVMTAGTALRDATYPDAAQQAAFYDRLLPRVEALVPGGTAAAADWWPLQPPRVHGVERAGMTWQSAQAGVLAVSAHYFDVLRIALRDGRPIEARDRLDSERVAVISESLARRLWPGARAIGDTLTILPRDNDNDTATPISVLIVGVVSDVRQTHDDSNLEDVYLPLAQRPNRFAYVYLRGVGVERLPAHAIREAAAVAGRDAAMGEPRLLSAAVAESRARPLWLAGVLASLAAAATALALIGLYGSMSYAVHQRQREVAIRVALGATRAIVMRLFLKHGARVVGLGVILGCAGALALGRILSSQLFGVSSTDARLLSAGVLTIVIGAVLAIWRPARRAGRLRGGIGD
ncbi:MAG: ABC transporter permease [Acidobacteria bacterium]|nr:ABC transporter permease [Acidobacteriota bacterium]